MVTWLQIQFFLVIGMDLRVTKLVTNGYIGYKGFKAVQAVSFSVQKGSKLKLIPYDPKKRIKQDQRVQNIKMN